MQGGLAPLSISILQKPIPDRQLLSSRFERRVGPWV